MPAELPSVEPPSAESLADPPPEPPSAVPPEAAVPEDGAGVGFGAEALANAVPGALSTVTAQTRAMAAVVRLRFPDPILRPPNN